MGDSSRLYTLLVREKNEEDETRRREGDHSRSFLSFSSIQRLSKGIRRSFRKIRTLGSKISQGRTLVSNKDSGYETVTKEPEKSPDSESLDSGLESDHSVELVLPHRSSDKSVQTTKSYDESFSSVDITRKSSNLSSRTIDSGIQSRTSPGCLVTHRIHSVPKKRVSILLPGERRDGSIFGSHLKVERTRYYETCRQPAVRPKGSVSSQRRELLERAKKGLISMHPDLCDTIRFIFQTHPDLRSLNSDEIGDLLFNLRAILYRNLLAVPYFETCVFVIQLFLFNLSSIVCSLPGMGRFPSLLQDLMLRSRSLGYSSRSCVLRETQEIYIQLWCSLINQF